MSIYDNLKKNNNNIVQVTKVNDATIHFVKGPFVEITGPKQADYRIDFIDNNTGNILYSGTQSNNMWSKCNIEYFVDWKIVIYENGVLWKEYHYDVNGKHVYIALDSKALGDTLGWFPMADEFRKKHNCRLSVSTFNNKLFRGQYPDIKFVEPGEVVDNIYAMYTLGLFYNEDGSLNMFMHPNNPREQPMQKMASDILGLEYKEVRPKLRTRPINIDKDSKQITVGLFGTAQAKFWNNPNGWQEVVDWLKGRGYTVRVLSKEPDNYMGNRIPKGVIQQGEAPLVDLMDEMRQSKAFIGIGSGLSWLSWALNVPTVLISGFSYDWAEMQDCIRISAPAGKCQGCFNRLRLDAGDWHWCPDHKDTPKHYECTKTITSDMVIKELEKFL